MGWFSNCWSFSSCCFSVNSQSSSHALLVLRRAFWLVCVCVHFGFSENKRQSELHLFFHFVPFAIHLPLICSAHQHLKPLLFTYQFHHCSLSIPNKKVVAFTICSAVGKGQSTENVSSTSIAMFSQKHSNSDPLKPDMLWGFLW